MKTARLVKPRALYEVGDKVVAKKTITEGGEGRGKERVPFLDAAGKPNKNYIHARKGETGTVVHVDYPHTWPTVRFSRTGTATLVTHREIVKP